MLTAGVRQLHRGGEADAMADGNEDRIGRTIGGAQTCAPHGTAVTAQVERVAAAMQLCIRALLHRVTLESVEHVQILSDADGDHIRHHAEMTGQA